MSKCISNAVITGVLAVLISICLMGTSIAGTLQGSGEDYAEKYEADQYKVGTDIPAGEYVVFATNGKGYFCLSSDGNQNDIIQNENFEYNTIITIPEGTYFELSRSYAVPIDDVEELDLSGSGFFKAGLHFPAGEYKLKADTNKGYYCIYEDSTQEHIISNDNFESSQYVTVQNGQYLKLSRCSFAETPPHFDPVFTDVETVREVQELLNKAGYDCGTPDGSAGPNTQAAVLKYKQDHGLEENSDITRSLINALKGKSSKTEDTSDNSDTANAANTVNTANTSAEQTASAPASAEEDTHSVTTGEMNALSTANRYLSIMAFSYSGLIDQLIYEGYTNTEATYAADHCGADWSAQALKSAKSYLKMMAFSYSGLIDQLIYEGYSNIEATYAADNCGADWKEQAAKSAKSYTSFMAFSREGLIDQLEYEGFTYEQAVYGADAVGY